MKPIRDASNSRWPNLYIVGVAKAGTTTLHGYLDQHPDIWMSPVKEPHFFADVNPERGLAHLVRPLDEGAYLAMFRGRRERYVGEASPSYMWDPKSPERIHTVAPNAKIIISLRQPLDRMASHYLMDRREGLQKLPFSQAVRQDWSLKDKMWAQHGHLYVELGLVADQIDRYLALFGSERVLVIEFAELTASPKTCIARACSFLGVDSTIMTTRSIEVQNAATQARNDFFRRFVESRQLRRVVNSLVPKSVRRAARDVLLTKSVDYPELDPLLLAELSKLYASDLERVEGLLGHTLKSLRLDDGSSS